MVALGVRGGMSDGVEVWRRPCRRPESVVPAAMVEPHRVVRWSFLTIVIPTKKSDFFVVFLSDG